MAKSSISTFSFGGLDAFERPPVTLNYFDQKSVLDSGVFGGELVQGSFTDPFTNTTDTVPIFTSLFPSSGQEPSSSASTPSQQPEPSAGPYIWNYDR